MPVSAPSHYYGLSGSGLDVDSMVKQLMQAQQAGYDKIWQQQQQTTWKKEGYNSIYSLVQDFRNNTLFNFKMQSSLEPKMTTTSDTNSVTATANADAGNVTHDISVSQLAASAKLTSSSAITTGASKTNLATQLGLDVNTTYTLKLSDGTNSATISVTGANTIYDLVQKINTAQNSTNNQSLNITANYDTSLDRFFLYSTQTGSASLLDVSGADANGTTLLNKLNLGLTTDSITVNSTFSSKSAVSLTAGLSGQIGNDSNFSSLFSGGSPIALNFGFVDKTGTVQNAIVTVNSTDSIQTVLDNINSALKVGGIQYGTVSYDADQKKFQFNSTTSDSLQSNIYFGTMAGDHSVVTDATTLSFMKTSMNLALSGQDAKFNLDGQNLTKSSNSFTISGVTYNLKSVTTNLTNPDVKIGISPDIDKTISNVKSFVDSYNTIVKAINTLVTESKYSDYLPLTDAQKSAMKDSDITAWTTKAKSGLLQHDDILQSTLDEMRSAFISPVSGVLGPYNSAGLIGIGTGASFDANGALTNSLFDGGQMQVNEDKLRTALQTDPNAVYKIFGTSDSDPNKQGIVVKLYSSLKDVMDKLSDRAGTPDNQSNDTQSSLAKQLSDFKTRLSNYQQKMTDMQNRYYTQFDALETAINQMNQQSSWLTSQLK